MGEVKPEDASSGLVERSWVRTSRRRGVLSEQTLEGEQIKAAWMEGTGQVRRATGKVIRNPAGELVVESWADGLRQEAAVPREANGDRVRR